MQKELIEYLKNVDYIDFAVLFGSRVRGKPHPWSDLDLGIATTRKVSLPEIGFLISQLETITRKNLDLVIINDLYYRNPVLAFEIACGKMLFARDITHFVNFKEKAFLSFMDTQFLREMVNQSFLERLKGDRFGKRNAS